MTTVFKSALFAFIFVGLQYGIECCDMDDIYGCMYGIEQKCANCVRMCVSKVDTADGCKPKLCEIQRFGCAASNASNQIKCHDCIQTCGEMTGADEREHSSFCQQKIGACPRRYGPFVDVDLPVAIRAFSDFLTTADFYVMDDISCISCNGINCSGCGHPKPNSEVNPFRCRKCYDSDRAVIPPGYKNCSQIEGWRRPSKRS